MPSNCHATTISGPRIGPRDVRPENEIARPEASTSSIHPLFVNGDHPMNGAELLARMLRAYDVRCVFGVPGDTNIHFYTALDALPGAPRHILTRDERSAGFMADAYARLTRRPGVVEVPSGAGPMYALPAIAEANESSVPLILLTFDMPMSGEGRGIISQFVDLAQLLAPVTKLSVQIKAAAKIPETIRRAFRIATTGRPGAVHLVIPEDILHQELGSADQVALHAEEACKTSPAYAPCASTADVLALRNLITSASRPLLVAGGGVNLSGGGQALTTLAERYRIPVVTTMTGRNAIPDHHDLALGIVGDNGFLPQANRALEESDLLIYFGCRIGSVVSIGWTFPPPRPDRKIVQVDICPDFLANNTVNALSIHGDARAVLEQLNALPAPERMRTDLQWMQTLRRWTERFWQHSAEQLASRNGGPLPPQAVIEALNRRMQGPYCIFADPGTSTSYLNRFLRLRDPRSRVIIPRAYGGLGYAIPAVIGGWLAHPGSRPIALFGDGSFGMSVGELESIARLQVPAILLNFNNSSFGWIKALQKSRGVSKPLSVDFSTQDAAAVAQGFGLHAIRATTASELEAGLDAAFAYDGPVLLDIVVESVAEVVPPVYKWLRQAGIDPLAIDGQPLV